MSQVRLTQNKRQHDCIETSANEASLFTQPPIIIKKSPFTNVLQFYKGWTCCTVLKVCLNFQRRSTFTNNWYFSGRVQLCSLDVIELHKTYKQLLLGVWKKCMTTEMIRYINWNRVRWMDAYPYEWVCVSPGGNAGKTSCHTWNTQMASPLHTQNIKLLAILPIRQLREKKALDGKKNPKNVKSGNTETDRLLTSAKGILGEKKQLFKCNWCQIICHVVILVFTGLEQLEWKLTYPQHTS